MSKTEVLPNNVALTDLAGRINTEHEAVCEAAMTATQPAAGSQPASPIGAALDLLIAHEPRPNGAPADE